MRPTFARTPTFHPAWLSPLLRFEIEEFETFIFVQFKPPVIPQLKLKAEADKACTGPSVGGANFANYLPLAGGTMTGDIVHMSYSKSGHMTRVNGAFAIQSVVNNASTALHLAAQANINNYAAMVYKESERCLEFQFV